MRILKAFVHYTLSDERIPVRVNGDQKVEELLNYVKDYFKFGASYGGTEERILVLQYAGADLQGDWVFDDLNILPGSTLKCILKEEKLPDYNIYVKFRKEWFKFYDDTIDISTFKVFDLRVRLSELFGYPLSIFRLKPESSNTEMLDDYRIIDYGVERYGKLILETWIGWDNFLINCIKGYSKQVIKIMSSDEIIRQYQTKVALFIAAHYGQYDLANSMMNLGARPDRPVGEHPSRQWCSSNNSNKPEYLRCPIHEAVLNGQLKIVSLFSKDSVWVLEEKDGFGIPPWRLSLRNKHKDPVKNMNQKDVARFLLAKQFGEKKRISPTCSISINCYYNLKRWVENARQKVLLTHGFNKTSYKKRPFHKGGLVGYKVLVDGYNNNFKEYPNSFEAFKSKYPSYYFVNEEEKKNHVNPEAYFRTLNTVGAFNLLKMNAISKFSKLADEPLKIKEQPEEKVEKPKPQESKARALWKKAINKVINHNIISRNAEQLALLGYEVEGYKNNQPSSAKSKVSALKPRSPDRSPKNKSSKKNQGNTGILQLVKNQIAKEESEENMKVEAITNNQITNEKETKKKSKKTRESQRSTNDKSMESSLPPIELKRMKSISVSDMHHSTSFLPKVPSKSESFNKHKPPSTSMSMTSLNYLPKIQGPNSTTESPSLLEETTSTGFLAATMKSLIARANEENMQNNENNINANYHFHKNSIKNQTMKLYMKYCDGLTPRDNAKRCLTDANSFSNKSWLKQIQIGASMAQEQAKRRINLVAQN